MPPSPDIAANHARGALRHPGAGWIGTLALVAICALAARAEGQPPTPVMPGQGFSSGGGHSTAAGRWLTSAIGQPVCGPAGAANRSETAGWLRRPGGQVLSVPAAPRRSDRLSLDVWPNPATAQASVSFHIPAVPGASQPVRIRIYDVSGRLVRDLFSGARLAGDHAMSWDGRDGGGQAVAAGIYLFRLSAGTKGMTRRAVFVP